MKLHLPLSLRLSLALSVAAIAAAPSHAAMTIWDVSTWEGASDDGSFTVGNTSTAEHPDNLNLKYVALDTPQTWNGSWSVIFSARGADLTGNLSLIGLNLDRETAGVGIVEGATMSNGNLTLTTWSAASSGQSSGVNFSTRDDGTTRDNVTFVMSNDGGGNISLTAYDSSDFTTTLFSASRGGQVFSGTLSGFVFGGISTSTDPIAGIPEKFVPSQGYTNNVTFKDNSAVGSYGLTKVGFLSGSVATVNDLARYYYGDEQHHNLTWTGSAGSNWSDASWRGEGGDTTFSSFDSVTFATENARVTVDTSVIADAISVNANTTINLAEHLSASSVTVADGKELTLSGAGTAVVGTLTGGAVNVSGTTVTVEQAITGTTLTVSEGGTVTANSLVGVTATVGKATDSTSGSTLALSGENLGAAGSTTVVEGTLTLTGGKRATVAGNVTLGSVVNNLTGADTYAFVSGTDDVTLTFTGVTDLTRDGQGRETPHSGIGFGSMGTIIVAEDASLKTSKIYASNADSSNAVVQVKKGGTLEMSGSASNTMRSLDNKGTLTVASSLKIDNTDTSSNLGGTVNVGGTLTINGGTTEISGNVSAGQISVGNAATLRGSDDGKGKLTVGGSSNVVNKAPTLVGNFALVKESGSGALCFSGNNSGFTGSLAVKSGTLNLALFGDNALNLQDISVSNGTVMGLYARTLSGNDTAFKANVSVASLQASGGTLNANVVMGDTSELVLDGTLTLNGSLTLNSTALSGTLLSGLREEGNVATLVSGLAFSSLTIGSGVSTLAATDEAGQWTTDGYYQFSSADLEAAFGNLNPGAYEMRYYGTADGTNGSLALAYVPEPTSATLSLLALAGLCARRRRR